MKINYLIFLSLFACHELITAQIKPDYGIKFGINLADLRTDENSLSPRSSFHFGLEAEHTFNSQLGLQAELIYSRQGNVRRGRNEQGVKFDNVLALDYLNFPILMNYYVKDGWYFSSGIQIGFLLRAQLEETVGVDFNQDSVGERYKNADFGMIFGTGYKTEWGFIVELRYNWGFTNVLNESLPYTAVERNSVLQLQMSYRFK